MIDSKPVHEMSDREILEHNLELMRGLYQVALQFQQATVAARIVISFLFGVLAIAGSIFGVIEFIRRFK